MRLSQWFRPPRHLLVVFLGIALVPAATLGWLSWRLLEQDRALATQRIQERLDSAAQLAAAQLGRAHSVEAQQLAYFASLETSRLDGAVSQHAAQLGDDGLLLVVHPRDIRAFPDSHLLYYPHLSIEPEAPSEAFRQGEALEFRQRDHDGAVAVFRKLARSKDPAARGGALLGLARNLRKAGRLKEALAAYQELERLGGTQVGGLPAELVARYSRLAPLENLGRLSDAEREARAIYTDLQGGRWPLTRAAYHFYTQEISDRVSTQNSHSLGAGAGGKDRLALAAGAEALWEEWNRIQRSEADPEGSRSLWVYDRPVLLFWRSMPERLVALIAGRHCLEEREIGAVQRTMGHQGFRLALTDTEGRLVLGQLPVPGTPRAIVTPAETKLPWTLHVASADHQADLAELAGRRELLFAGLAMMALLVLAGVYFIARAVTRELEVARLQSDFVGAVSHEFRSPLTSMCQLTEMLAGGRVPNEERRQRYYQVLSRETARLHRLVEGLLNFGRMEAGAKEYRFEHLDIPSLVRTVVDEFRQEATELGYQVECALPEGGVTLSADKEALRRALWNLLDNAVKYSPECPTVWVEVSLEGNHLLIRVRDRGMGMSAGEQKKIFSKFVRGAAARSANVKGTGIGLAMVRRIVKDHGGQIRVASEPGEGSTFTIVLPVKE